MHSPKVHEITRKPRSPVVIVWLLAAVQFINILDFMMVMPMGPDFSVALGIDMSKLGLIGGSYTAAAAVSGFASSFFLDRFDRRRALAIALAGLSLGTLSGAFATGLHSLIAARILAGVFGGPATALSMAIVADVIAPARRGWAMGVVMSAFSVASVAGVPAGLELAQLGGWRLPFVVVAGLGFLINGGVFWLLPELRGHLHAKREASLIGLRRLAANSLTWQSLAMTLLTSLAMFILIPYIAAYVQFNLGYPRAHLGLLYLFGGISSFLAMRVAGRLVDKFGGAVVGSLASIIVALVMYLGFVEFFAAMTVAGIFVGFMGSTAFRNIAFQALASRVPGPQDRARFMSIQSAVQQLSSSAGAMLSTQMLSIDAQGALVGMPSIGWAAIILTLCLTPLFISLGHGVERQERVSNLSASPIASKILT